MKPPSSSRNATPGLRLFATLLDLFLILLVALPFSALLFPATDQPVPSSWPIPILFGLAAGFYTVLFWWRWQATPGMLLSGTRLVMEYSAKPPNLTRCSVRLLVLLIAVLPLGLGLLPALFKRRALHDRLCSTQVIEDDESTRSLMHILQELG